MENKRQFLCNFWHGKLQQAVNYLVFSLPSMASIQAEHISLKAENCQGVMHVNWT
jgi:hypothetical protein